MTGTETGLSLPDALIEGPFLEPEQPGGNGHKQPETLRITTSEHETDSPEYLSGLRNAGIANRSTLTLCINVLTDHPAEIVVAYNELTAAIYRVCQDGVLSRSDKDFSDILLQTRNRLTWVPEAPGPGEKGFPYHAAWCNKLAEPGIVSTLDKIALQAFGLLRKQPADSIPRFIPDYEIYKDLACIGTPDGVLDFRTLTILPKEIAREKLILGRTPTRLVPGADHPRIREFMPDYDTASPEEKHRQDLLGYDMSHPPTRHVNWAINPGGSGKTTEKNVLSETCGHDIINEMRPEALQRNDSFGKDSTSHNAEIFNLAAPARRTYVPDFGKSGRQGSADVPLILAASGGEAKLGGRRIRQDAEYFRPTSTIVVQGNRPRPGDTLFGLDPTPGSQDEALLDRVQSIIMPKPEQPDPWFRDKAPYDRKFREAVFYRIALAAQRQANADGPPPMPEAAIANRNSIVQDELPLWKREWLANAFAERSPGKGAIETGPPAATARDAYDDYQAWHKENGIGKEESRNAITESMKEKYDKDFPDGPPHQPYNPRGANGRRNRNTIFPRWTIQETA